MATFHLKNEVGAYEKILLRKPKKEKSVVVADSINNSIKETIAYWSFAEKFIAIIPPYRYLTRYTNKLYHK